MENKINYEKEKIETQQDQITQSFTQIDINVQEMVQPIEKTKARNSFDVYDAFTNA